MASDEVVTDPFLALAELGGHLKRARKALPPKLRKRAPAKDSDDEQSSLPRVLDVAQAAVASLEGFAGGLRRSFAGGAAIELSRSANKVSVIVLGSPPPDDIAAFIDELARIDQRLQDATALLGLLLGLCASWAAVGFAPPLVLKDLAECGPQILELGAALCRAAGSSD